MQRRTLAALAAALLLALSTWGCSDDGDGSAGDRIPSSTTTARHGGYFSETYADDAAWLCRPGGAPDVCTNSDLTATEVRRDLSTAEVPFDAAPDTPADCFYAYPAVHPTGAGPNWTDQEDRAAEETVARDQAVRFTSVCQVYAPWYPQAVGAPGMPLTPEAEQTAYDSLRDAFLHYLDQHGAGRPFVLLGHGQGADLLARLLREEVEQQPARLALLVSAVLVGSTRVVVPPGSPVGGTFQNVPLCAARDQTACVVAFHAFQVGVPPPAGGGPLGASIPAGMVAACTNPAGLDGSKGQFRSAYFSSTDPGLPPVPTPYVLYREYYRGECVTTQGLAHVAVDRTTDPSDTRPLGPVASSPGQEAGLGLFSVEWDLAQGDLLDLVAQQSGAR